MSNRLYQPIRLVCSSLGSGAGWVPIGCCAAMGAMRSFRIGSTSPSWRTGCERLETRSLSGASVPRSLRLRQA